MKSYSRDTKSHHISRKIPGHIASGFSIFMKLMLMISIFKKAYEYHQLILIIPFKDSDHILQPESETKESDTDNRWW